MDYKCPACGSIYYPGEKFCQNCGAKLPTEPPAAPAYEAPAAPAYEAPAAPMYQQPAAPAYENNAPTAPMYQQPAAPAYQQPAAPVYQQPAYPPAQNAPVYPPSAAPVYAQSAAPGYAAPAAPKKKKTGLIIGLIAGGVALLAVIAVVLFLLLKSPSPDSVSLSETSLNLEPWESAQLTATILPEKASEDQLTWTSSDEDVATVYDGYVTAWEEGTCTITVTTSNGITETCYVYVSAVEEPTEPTEPIASSEYDKYVIGEWNLTFSFDWNTEIDTPVEELGLNSIMILYSDHTAYMTWNDDSTDELTWGFDYVDDWGDYMFWLDDGTDSVYFRYEVVSGEIWLYLEDDEITLTYVK